MVRETIGTLTGDSGDRAPPHHVRAVEEEGQKRDRKGEAELAWPIVGVSLR